MGVLEFFFGGEWPSIVGGGVGGADMVGVVGGGECLPCGLGGVVAIGGGVVAGVGNDSFGREVEVEAVACPRDGGVLGTAVYIQGAPATFAYIEQERGDDTGVAEVGVENLGREFTPSAEGGFVLVGKGVGLHAQVIAHPPALAFGDARVGGVVPAAVNFVDGDVTTAVADALPFVIHQVAVPIDQKRFFEAKAHLDKGIIVVEGGVEGGVFVDNGQFYATVFAHVEARQEKFIGIGVQNGGAVLADAIALGDDCFGFVGVGVGFVEDVDGPDHAGLLGSPCGPCLVDKLGLEGDFVACEGVFDKVKRDVKEIRAVAFGLNGDAVFVEQGFVGVAVAGAGQVAEVGHGDFEHGHEFDIAVGIGGHLAVGAACLAAMIEEGGSIPVLHVPFFVFGPVKNVEGVPETVGVGRP